MKVICVHILYDKNWYAIWAYRFYCEVICTLTRINLWLHSRFDLHCYIQHETKYAYELVNKTLEITRKVDSKTILFAMQCGYDVICTNKRHSTLTQCVCVYLVHLEISSLLMHSSSEMMLALSESYATTGCLGTFEI